MACRVASGISQSLGTVGRATGTAALSPSALRAAAGSSRLGTAPPAPPSAVLRPCHYQQQQRRTLASLRCASRRQVLQSGPFLPLLLGPSCLLPPSGSAGAAGASRIAAAAMSSDAAAAAATSGSSPTGAIVVYVTVPSAEVGDSLASKLVEAKLAACVNIVPGLTSVYWWDGKVNKDPELLLIIKTREELLSQLTAFVRANHPYDEPEVVGLPILGGSPSYLKWLRDSASAPASFSS